MIPGFDQHGYLPPGVHRATLDEIDQRFGTRSELRRAQVESIRWIVETAKKAGVKRIILDGSFTTDLAEPNDVDCLLLIDERFPIDRPAERELREGLPFLDIELADQPTFDFYVERMYATDRSSLPKGMIEVIS